MFEQKIRWFTYLLCLSILLSAAVQAQVMVRPENKNTEIRYYGTACFTVERAGSVLLTDPFVSNPSLTDVMFGKVRTQQEQVERYINPATLGKVKTVIVGHAHYDHLLDLPYLSRYIPNSALVLASRTAKHILAYYQIPQTVLVMNDMVGTHSRPGYWVYSADSTMRVMAFKSRHPPHIAGLNMMNRRYTTDLTSEPVMMSDWQEGLTLAYMVDWLDKDSILYRMYFSSSLAKSPDGLFPKQLLEEHPINDLFVSAALFDNMDLAPGPLIDLASPERVILMHWENFFRSKEQRIKAINRKQLKRLQAELQQRYGDRIRIVLPQPLRYY